VQDEELEELSQPIPENTLLLREIRDHLRQW
jgi:hypothetical protein